MATLVLQTLGATVGTALGGPIGGAIGSALGATAGSAIDQRLFGPGDRSVQGPRLDSVRILTSREGAPIARAYGRTRIAGEIIWATQLQEVQTVQRQKSGGKGSAPKTTTTTYTYLANFAIGLCEGPIGGVGRIWADGKLLEQTGATIRVHNGDQQQLPDSLIEAKQGSGAAPAYRGTAYIVFERLALERYGNRIPQISVEVLNAIGDVEKSLQGVNLIPGATEFGYDTQPVIERVDAVESRSLNVNQTVATTDFLASIDALQASVPGIEQVALVVSWFGDDLRAGQCSVAPRVEVPARNITSGQGWSVAGIGRQDARTVSQIEGRPAYGGTPSDGSVLRAIAELKRRGLRVALNPFVLMDVPAGNELPAPDGSASQPAFPWRGQITCDPAEGIAETVNKTAAARQQVQSFASQNEWSYRRLIQHYVALAKLAGGVDVFIIGSEMRGLTHVRDDNDAFPFVEELRFLAAHAKQELGASCTVTYGADWSEYFGHQPDDGSGDVFYNLDPLWADPSIDAVGIDNYLPLTDWRDAGDPVDALRSVSDPEYLAAGFAGGEGFDWFYASEVDRKAGQRTPITDGLGKPWVYRPKDIRSWWENEHYERRNGTELAGSSSWVPESKPVIFTEYGCPAIHNGTNQPNVFFDPKSDQSSFPYFSSGSRDDAVQRAYLRATNVYWSNLDNNPQSTSFNGSMVDLSRSQAWAWDARPFPNFPLDDELWSDGANWQRGHWLNGRMGGIAMADLIVDLLRRSGIENYDVSRLEEVADGYIVAETGSVRAAIEVLIELYGWDVFEDAGVLNFVSRGIIEPALIGDHEIASVEVDRALVEYSIEQESELPATVHLQAIDGLEDYQEVQRSARRIDSASLRQQSFSAPIVVDAMQAERQLLRWLHDGWTGRHSVTFALPRWYQNLTVGDLITFASDEGGRIYRIAQVEEGDVLEVTGRATEFPRLTSTTAADEVRKYSSRNPATKPLVRFLDLPVLPISAGASGNWVVATSRPWTGALSAFASPTSIDFDYRGAIEQQATVGEIQEGAAGCGTISRWDDAARPVITLFTGTLSSAETTQVLAGGNAIAVRHQEGWEIVQFQQAELVADSRWRLSRLLRGQAGTEALALNPLQAGRDVVLLDGALTPLPIADNELGLALNWRVGSGDNPLSDASFTGASYVSGYRSVTPLSPVHLKISGSETDGFSTSWIRRDRSDVGDWNAVETAMSEVEERYSATLLFASGAEITHDIQQSETVFSASEISSKTQSGDSVSGFRVAQMSTSYGLGDPAFLTIN